ncbi:hypothetical protein [Staphylococcus muscae]|uniref:Uncharacterized protein n=1 Tax=Staphylococcus muscae TaxID=1294 RepID=A0ABQ1HVV2_9STAP|nr:hypothetical protein [Staphylococcus muscae]GGA93335.1 hypothetical protein GCM10007183_16910 [Staphylococcus muscae]
MFDYKAERDSLIEDVARLRKEKDELKDNLDKVVDLFNRHLRYKLAVTNNGIWYVHLKHELQNILKEIEK